MNRRLENYLKKEGVAIGGNIIYLLDFIVKKLQQRLDEIYDEAVVFDFLEKRTDENLSIAVLRAIIFKDWKKEDNFLPVLVNKQQTTGAQLSLFGDIDIKYKSSVRDFLHDRWKEKMHKGGARDTVSDDTLVKYMEVLNKMYREEYRLFIHLCEEYRKLCKYILVSEWRIRYLDDNYIIHFANNFYLLESLLLIITVVQREIPLDMSFKESLLFWPSQIEAVTSKEGVEINDILENKLQEFKVRVEDRQRDRFLNVMFNKYDDLYKALS
jgi:hypothetical protein